MRQLFIAVFVLAVSRESAVAQVNGSADSVRIRVAGYEVVSFVRLLSNPRSYEGRRIQIRGYFHLKYEDSALYLSKDDADYLTSENALWVSFVDDPEVHALVSDSLRSLRYFDGRPVILRGEFTMKERGHLGVFAGTLNKVDYIFEDKKWYDGARDLSR